MQENNCKTVWKTPTHCLIVLRKCSESIKGPHLFWNQYFRVIFWCLAPLLRICKSCSMWTQDFDTHYPVRGATVCLNLMLSIILWQSVSVFLKDRYFLRSLTPKVSVLLSSEEVVSLAPWWIEPKKKKLSVGKFTSIWKTSIVECYPETTDPITRSKKLTWLTTSQSHDFNVTTTKRLSTLCHTCFTVNWSVYKCQS